MNNEKIYLGDGVYAEFGPMGITVWTQRLDGKHYMVFDLDENIPELIRFINKCYGTNYQNVPNGH